MVGCRLWSEYRAGQEEEEPKEVSHQDETNYAVIAVMSDGTENPNGPDDTVWLSYETAVRVAAKAYDVRVNVVNSPVREIKIVDADYETVMSHKFEDEEEEDV